MEVWTAAAIAVLVASAVYLLTDRNLVRVLLGIVLIGNAVNLAIFLAGDLMPGAPSLIPAVAEAPFGAVANAQPQALVLTDIARHSLEPFTGIIRMGVLPTIGPYLMPHVLPSLHAAYPRLKFYVREGKADHLLPQLTKGDFDLLILPLPVDRAGMQIRPLAREPLLVALSIEHRLARRKALRRRDLTGEDVLIMEGGHRLHEQVGALCQEIGARPLTDYEGTSLDALRQMVGLGMGITFLPQLYARLEAVKDPQVVTLPVIDRPPSRELAALWRARSPLADELATIADAIREWLRDAMH